MCHGKQVAHCSPYLIHLAGLNICVALSSRSSQSALLHTRSQMLSHQHNRVRVHQCASLRRTGAVRAAPRQPTGRHMRLCVVAAAPKASQYTPSSAKDAVERGLAAFKDSKDYDEAERLFQAAMDLNPSSQEGVAALYNLGCAYAKQQKWQQAADAIGRAVNEYDLKLSVALQVRGHR